MFSEIEKILRRCQKHFICRQVIVSRWIPLGGGDTLLSATGHTFTKREEDKIENKICAKYGRLLSLGCPIL